MYLIVNCVFCKGAGRDVNSETPSYEVISYRVVKLHLSGEAYLFIHMHVITTQEHFVENRNANVNCKTPSYQEKIGNVLVITSM